MRTRSKRTQELERKIKQQPQNIKLSESNHFKMKLSTIQRVLGDYIRKKVTISKSRAMDLLKEVTAIHGCIQYTKDNKIQQVTAKLIRQMKTIIEENDTNLTPHHSQLQAEDKSRNTSSNMQSEELRSSQSTPSDIETIEKLGNGLQLINIYDITKADKKRRRPNLYNETTKNKILKNKGKETKKDKAHTPKVIEKITQPLTTSRARNDSDYSSCQRQQASEHFYANIQTTEAEELRSSQSTPSNIDPADNAKPTQSEWEPNEASSDNLPGVKRTYIDLGSSSDKDNVGSISSTHNAKDTFSTIMHLDSNIEQSRNDETPNSNSQSILQMHNDKNWVSDKLLVLDNQSIHLNKIYSHNGQNTPKMSHHGSVIHKVAEDKEKLNFTSVVIAKAAADTGSTCTYNSERCNKNVNHAYANKQRNIFEQPINKGEPFRKTTGLINKVYNINYLKSIPILTANLVNNYGKDIIRNTCLEKGILTNLSKPIQKHTNAGIENFPIPRFKIPNEINSPISQISKKKGNSTESDILKNTNMSEVTQVQPFSDSVNTIPDSQYIDSGTYYSLPKLLATSNGTSKSNSKLPKKKIAKTIKNSQRKPKTNSKANVKNTQVRHKTNSKANNLLENNSTNVSFGKNISFCNKNNEVKELFWLHNLKLVRCIKPEEYSTYCDETFWREDVTFPGLCHEDFTN